MKEHPIIAMTPTCLANIHSPLLPYKYIPEFVSGKETTHPSAFPTNRGSHGIKYLPIKYQHKF
jgi:hypothetical protein